MKETIKQSLKTKIRPMMKQLSTSFYSGSSQSKCKELYDIIKTKLNANDYLSTQNIIEYEGYKIKMRFAGQKGWRFSQVYDGNFYDYDLYIRMFDNEDKGLYLIDKEFFTTFKGSKAHAPCKSIKAFSPNKSVRETIIKNYKL